jgi:hypothetical protein
MQGKRMRPEINEYTSDEQTTPSYNSYKPEVNLNIS